MIRRPLSHFAFAVTLPALVVVVLTILAAFFRGTGAALALLILGFIAANALLALYVCQLIGWIRQPSGSAPPQVDGPLGRVYAELDERMKREHALRATLTDELARFQQAAQAMPDGLVYLADDGSIEWLNVMAEHHFELDRRHDLRVPLVNLVRQPEFVRYLQAGNYGEPLLMHPARRRERALQVQVIRFAGNRKMVLSRDISQLERLENMRRDFVANVSHEMRTPLTVIGGFLETIADGADDFSREDIAHFVRLAHEQSDRMQRLIEDLLTLSALETGAPAAVEEMVDAVELVTAVHREAQMLSAGRHTIELIIDGGGVLLGSRKELYSACANLAINAVRYTPSGGHIEIGWHSGPVGGAYWVEDDGIGIDPEHLPRLTERFYRVDRGRSRETGGTGLGLAIVKHILTRHHGTLEVSSEPGVGSRFEMRFPAARLRLA